MTKLSVYEKKERARVRRNREITATLVEALAFIDREGRSGSDVNDRLAMFFGFLLGHVDDDAERARLCARMWKQGAS